MITSSSNLTTTEQRKEPVRAALSGESLTSTPASVVTGAVVRDSPDGETSVDTYTTGGIGVSACPVVKRK
jgi:hypothetical protein